MNRRHLRAEDFNVGWLCALPVECVAAEHVLDEVYDGQVWADKPYLLGRIGEYKVVIRCLPSGFIGTNIAAAIAAQLESDFPCITTRLMVGIGGGVPSAEADVRLGDVVISQPDKGYGGVVQYSFGKVGADGKLKPTGFLNAPPTFLLDALTGLRTRILSQKSKFWEYLAAFDTLLHSANGE